MELLLEPLLELSLKLPFELLSDEPSSKTAFTMCITTIKIAPKIKANINGVLPTLEGLGGGKSEAGRIVAYGLQLPETLLTF